MTKEFNLSEKKHIEYGFMDENKELSGIEVIPTKDIKEFIKIIEGDLHWKFSEGDLWVIMNIIKKRAGEELSK